MFSHLEVRSLSACPVKRSFCFGQKKGLNLWLWQKVSLFTTTLNSLSLRNFSSSTWSLYNILIIKELDNFTCSILLSNVQCVSYPICFIYSNAMTNIFNQFLILSRHHRLLGSCGLFPWCWCMFRRCMPKILKNILSEKFE